MMGRGAGVVELACLENKCAFTCTEGSNPSLSARRRLGKIVRSYRVFFLQKKKVFEPVGSITSLSHRSLLRERGAGSSVGVYPFLSARRGALRLLSGRFSSCEAKRIRPLMFSEAKRKSTKCAILPSQPGRLWNFF